MESLFEPKPPPHLAFPNGALKKHAHPPAPAANADGEYKECLKNHAAALGGHAVDGCGEFTPSPTSDPAVPSSLTCAACGCHRNFHRRLVHHHHRHLREPNSATAGRDGGAGDSEDEDDDDDEGAGDRHAPHFRGPRRRSRSPPRHYSSASHMLLALSGGREAARSGPAAPGHGGEQLHRRRARTKFSQEQKAKMHELSEKLGWRMPKRDDGAVEEFCRRIGVERGVFKVWMHNNKQTFAGTSGGTPTSRKAADGDSGGGGGGGGGEVDGAVGFTDGVDVNGEKFVVNGSPSSSSPS